ncbi:YybH family protein [Robertkochia solimangrovi]|uniref:YybH family protein n=1 Tax=Robertkochia solimangrovi TaxID=2213046 RepID=UPI00117F187C|nr:nuclear transport factor 2 family protein [Robertkochia solimangrovi]TRZ46257.1 DUF4440 domain-containing protein [Robertkochia solimangrovi]
MKSKLFSLVLLFLTIGLSAQQTLVESDKNAVLEVLQLQEDAWNKGDITEFMEGYWKSDSLAFVGSGGPVFGWKATKDRYFKSYPNTTAMGKLSFTVNRIQQVSPVVIQLIGEFHLTRTIGDLSGYFTLIWRKFGDQWVIISDHTSSADK